MSSSKLHQLQYLHRYQHFRLHRKQWSRCLHFLQNFLHRMNQHWCLFHLLTLQNRFSIFHFFWFHLLHQYRHQKKCFYHLQFQKNHYSKSKLFHVQSLHQNYRVFQFFHSNQYQHARKLHQLFVRLLRRLSFLKNSNQNIKNHILRSTICTRCSLKNSRKQIVYISRNVHLFQTFFFIKLTLRSISDLQSIRANQLVKARKRQIREIFNNIRSRNRIASNSYFLFSTNNLRNRSLYYTKHRSFFVYLIQKYRTFCHTNCLSSLIVYFVYLFLESFSTFSFARMFVAFATIFLNRTMICIDIYEQFISIKHLVMILKSFERSNAISWLENLWHVDEKTNRFFIFLHVLLLDFSKNESHVLVTWHNENVVIFFRWWHLLR